MKDTPHPVRFALMPPWGICPECHQPTRHPIHDVPGTCVRCRKQCPAFTDTCDDCRDAIDAAAIAARIARLAAYDARSGEDADEADTYTTDEPKAHSNEPDPVFKAAHAEAVRYIASYTGKFALILDLRADPRWGTKWYRLSRRQVEVVLDAKRRDEERAKQRVQTGRNLTVLPEGRTYAAVDNDSGSVTFLIIDHCGPTDRWGNPSKWAGWVFVKQQQGPNEVKLGSQRPGESYVGQWANLIDKVLADPVAAVARYGLELGVCGVCHKALTNQESREQGIGPVCKARIAA